MPNHNSVTHKNLTIHLPTKRILWSDNPDQIQHVIKPADVIKCCPDAAHDEEIFDQIRNDMLSDKLDFIRKYADEAEGKLVCVGIVNTWSGRFIGLKSIDTYDVGKCFESNENNAYITWGIDVYNNLVGILTHHDGTNYMLYRAYKPLLSDRQIDNFEMKVCNGKITNYDISVYTESLGKYLKNITCFK